MQWSDETVERVARVICRGGICGPKAHLDEQENTHWRKFELEAKAALAAVAECKEVRELVYSAKKAIASLSYAEMQGLPEGRIITFNKDALQTSLAPFTEGK